MAGNTNLLALPREVRNNIYKYVYKTYTICVDDCAYRDYTIAPMMATTIDKAPELGVLLSCTRLSEGYREEMANEFCRDVTIRIRDVASNWRTTGFRAAKPFASFMPRVYRLTTPGTRTAARLASFKPNGTCTILVATLGYVANDLNNPWTEVRYAREDVEEGDVPLDMSAITTFKLGVCVAYETGSVCDVDENSVRRSFMGKPVQQVLEGYHKFNCNLPDGKPHHPHHLSYITAVYSNEDAKEDYWDPAEAEKMLTPPSEVRPQCKKHYGRFTKSLTSETEVHEWKDGLGSLE